MDPRQPSDFDLKPDEVVDARVVPKDLVDIEVINARAVELNVECKEEQIGQEDGRSRNLFFEDRHLVKSLSSLDSNSQPGSVVDALAVAADFDQSSLSEDYLTDDLPSQDSPERNSRARSWLFRWAAAVWLFVERLFGMASIIFLLAFAANVPIVQLMSFGYLLEVTGRLARNQKLRDAMIGLNKASVLGGIVLGTWLMLFPVRFVSGIWYEAYLIDPNSNQTLGMRIFQMGLMGFMVAHIAAVWFCGGKLRYFFWPVIAPFSFAIWAARKVAGASLFRKILSIMIGWMSPALVDDVCNAKPMTDWFVPAIAWNRVRTGNLYVDSRDGVWDFFASLNLGYYFMLGLKGFLGTFLWLVVPTSLLVSASYTEGGLAVLTGVFGVLFAIPIFMMLPFLQARFAKDGKLSSFLDLYGVFRNFGRAPWAHLVALLLTLVLALPLFFLKISEIPSELFWMLSVMFVVFSWPARIIVGLAYRRGTKRDRPSRWWIRYPIAFLGIPLALTFALILTLTRYVSWSGAMSLFENHVFLLPAPFWI